MQAIKANAMEHSKSQYYDWRLRVIQPQVQLLGDNLKKLELDSEVIDAFLNEISTRTTIAETELENLAIQLQESTIQYFVF